MRRVADEQEELGEAEIQAEPTQALIEEQVPEPSAQAREAVDEAESRADESSQEVFETYIEPDAAAPEEAAVHVVPDPEVASEAEAAEEEDVSLESIVEELKRREGR
jgi:hypothetical protein